jgi:RNA polymerase sigma factor (sigma-70 family)
MDAVLRHLRRAALAQGGALTDGQLLERFATGRDQDAFAALLRRHGRMVLGVCRRVLGNAHDAEDAFQVTFLVLARKASSLRSRTLLGGWLYGVAYRTALKARTMLARRRAHERAAGARAARETGSQDPWQEFLPLLDQELQRLPEKYRLAVVLCELEGRTRKEVARQLGIPEGTLSSRLAAARKTLARRLARHGDVLLGGCLAALRAGGAASACVPATLLHSTTKAATALAVGPAATAGTISVTIAALTEGVMQAMFLAKVKTAAAVLIGVTALGLGTGGVLYQARGQTAGMSVGGGDRVQAQVGKDAQRTPPRPMESARERALREELEALRGQLAQAQAQAAAQRDRAEAERQQAEYTLRVAQAQLQQLQAQTDKAPVTDIRPGRATDLEKQKALLHMDFEARRRQLHAELESLAAQHQRALADLEAAYGKRPLTSGKEGAKQPPTQGQASGSGDKLDRILERLDRLERLVDRLLERPPARQGK